MDVLLGTTNPSKASWITSLLEGCSVRLLTLHDLGITGEPEEAGVIPEENAMRKAEYYARFFDRVICHDSGLYFDDLPLEDPRQPGLHVRTPGGGKRLNDREMTEYYSALIHSLGGRVTAFYLNGFAVYNRGRLRSLQISRETARQDAFYMVDTPMGEGRPGWPLDPLSLNRRTLTCFTAGGSELYGRENQAVCTVGRDQMAHFLKEALDLPGQL